MELHFDEIGSRIVELLHYDSSAPLIFNSGLFLFLFVAFLAVYLLLRRTITLRILYVTAFSLFFYYKSSGIYFLLLVFAAVSDYLISHSIARSKVLQIQRLGRYGWRHRQRYQL